MKIGEKIFLLRKQKGWSQAQLANKAGLSQSGVQWLEKGKGRTTKHIFKIAEAFGVETSELVECEDVTFLLNKIPKNYIPILKWNEIENFLKYGYRNIKINTDERDFIRSPLLADNHKKIFGIKTENDSMTSNNLLSFQPGTIIIAEKKEKCMSGNYVILKKHDEKEPFFRQIIKEGDTLFAKPLNSQYPFLKLNEDYLILAVLIARVDILV